MVTFGAKFFGTRHCKVEFNYICFSSKYSATKEHNFSLKNLELFLFLIVLSKENKKGDRSPLELKKAIATCCNKKTNFCLFSKCKMPILDNFWLKKK